MPCPAQCAVIKDRARFVRANEQHQPTLPCRARSRDFWGAEPLHSHHKSVRFSSDQTRGTSTLPFTWTSSVQRQSLSLAVLSGQSNLDGFRFPPQWNAKAAAADIHTLSANKKHSTLRCTAFTRQRNEGEGPPGSKYEQTKK